MPVEGGCYCGAFRYPIDAPMPQGGLCDCQPQHAPLGANLSTIRPRSGCQSSTPQAGQSPNRCPTYPSR